MTLKNLVSRTLVTFVALGLFSISAFSQTRPRILHPISDNDEVSSPSDGLALAVNVRDTKPAWEAKPKPTIDLSTATGPTNSAFLKYEPLLLTAIEERLGTPYRWGATGPDRFDCSGFVWSIYQEIGINFERASARTLFARFEAPPEGEQFQFGTLVFFSGLAHVGVVADANGFYHASRHHGVIYSKFDDYWTKRIDGFRRVPLTVQVAD